MDCCSFRVSPCCGRRGRGEATYSDLPPMMRDPGAPTHAPHPLVFMILILPFGVMSGYLTVAVAYLLTQAGVSVEQVAVLIAISFIPQTWKFMWAPIADTTLTRKSWYLIAAVISAVGIYATGAVPADGKFMPLLYVVVV